MQQLERRSDRWISTALSVVLHGALIAVLVYGWLSFRKEPKPTPNLAINATVVGPQALNGSGAIAKPTPHVQPKPTPPKPPPPVPAQTPLAQPPAQPLVDEETVPPPPDLAARQEAARKAKEAAAQKQAEQAQADAEQKAKAEAQRKEQEEAQLQAKADAERKAKEKAEEEKKAAEAKAAAEAKKRAAEQQRLAEAKRKAEEERRAAEAKELAMNPADLQQSINAEEKAMTARSGPAMASWVQLITARIEHAWIRPPSAHQGIDCLVDVTEVPGGQVVNVKVGSCNGDAAVVQSIQDAAFRASPLPAPPDPALFERDLQVEFKPTD